MSKAECPICGEQYQRLGHHFRVHDDAEVLVALLSILKNAAIEMGHPPTRREIDNRKGPSHGAFVSKFGTWNDALMAADFEPHQEKPDESPSKEQVKTEIERLADELGRPPTQVEMDERGRFSHNMAKARFDGWTDALEAADCRDPHRRYKSISDDDLLDYLHELADDLDHAPRRGDLEKYSPRVYVNRFGGWLDALREAGFDVDIARTDIPLPSGPDHPLWVESTDGPDYGPGWNEEKRERVRELDDYQCVNCGMPQKEHLERWNRRLHVHHITPAREVDDYKERNAIENLETLCVSCHAKYELVDMS